MPFGFGLGLPLKLPFVAGDFLPQFCGTSVVCTAGLEPEAGLVDLGGGLLGMMDVKEVEEERERGGDGGRPTEGFSFSVESRFAFSRGFRNMGRDLRHVVEQEKVNVRVGVKLDGEGALSSGSRECQDPAGALSRDTDYKLGLSTTNFNYGTRTFNPPAHIHCTSFTGWYFWAWRAPFELIGTFPAKIL